MPDGEPSDEAPGAPVPEITIVGAAPVARTAAPLLAFALRAVEPRGSDVRAIALSAAIHVQPERRPYDDATAARLAGVLGESPRRSVTRSILWRTVEALVLPFSGETIFELPVPCASEPADRATAYLSCLDAGDAPLTFRIAGIALYDGRTDGLAWRSLPAPAHLRFDLPVATWRRAFDGHPAHLAVALQRRTLSERRRSGSARAGRTGR